jgi:N-acyl-L-homoserine lactone synthetase
MGESNEVVVRVAARRDELEAIYRLRYEAYLRKGYIPPNPSGKKNDEWDELATTIQFAAVEEGKVLGAVRLVLDSHEGLPMERVFPREVADLRAQGRKVAEASTLVVDRCHDEPGRKTWLSLCEAVWQEAEARGVDDLCIAVTRNHLKLYKRLLFELIGAGKHYEALNGVFAYPLRLGARDSRVMNKRWGGYRDAVLRRRFLEESRCNND